MRILFEAFFLKKTNNYFKYHLTNFTVVSFKMAEQLLHPLLGFLSFSSKFVLKKLKPDSNMVTTTLEMLTDIMKMLTL